LGRPKSKFNPSAYTFNIWEDNRVELDKLREGNKSHEINLALKNHFRIRGKIEQDILFQIEEHKKIVEQHQRSINLLEGELGEQQEKQKEELENKDRELKEVYLEFCHVFKSAHNPYYYCSDKKANGEIKEKYGINVNRKLIDRVLDGSFSFDDYKGVV